MRNSRTSGSATTAPSPERSKPTRTGSMPRTANLVAVGVEPVGFANAQIEIDAHPLYSTPFMVMDTDFPWHDEVAHENPVGRPARP